MLSPCTTMWLPRQRLRDLSAHPNDRVDPEFLWGCVQAGMQARARSQGDEEPFLGDALVIDCRIFRDPERMRWRHGDRGAWAQALPAQHPLPYPRSQPGRGQALPPLDEQGLQRHLGVHPVQLERLVSDPAFPDFLRKEQRRIDQMERDCFDEKQTHDVNVVCFCKSGKHRSVAVAYLLSELYSRARAGVAPARGVVRTFHLTDHEYYVQCGICRQCTRDHPRRRDAVQYARSIFEGRR